MDVHTSKKLGKVETSKLIRPMLSTFGRRPKQGPWIINIGGYKSNRLDIPIPF